MIKITLTVQDTDQAEAVINHLMCDGFMYTALPVTISVQEKPQEEDDD